MQSLEGILVVALEQAVAAPYVSGRLARMGATVIKIERPEGDFARHYDHVVNGESAYFVWLNGGKQSLVLDIKQDEDRDLLMRILGDADVFIQNLAPGAAARAGLDSLALRSRFPRLVTCDISGYGEDGHYASRKAYDLLVQAESGLSMITGSADAPGRVGVSVCDIAAGMHALTGILEALYHREKTGVAMGVKVSLFDGMADWMTVPLLHTEYGGRAPERVGLKHPSIAPYGVFTAADGVSVLLSIQNPREWRSFCTEVLGYPEWLHDERFSDNEQRVQHRDELDAAIQERFSQWSGDTLSQRLESAAIAFGILNRVDDLARHPQLRRTRLDGEAGEVNVVASPIRFQEGNGQWCDTPVLRVPGIGEHSAALRQRWRKPDGQ